MDIFSTLTQTLTWQLAEDQVLQDTIVTQGTGLDIALIELNGYVETRVKTAQSLISQVQNRKIAVARYDLPAPSAAARRERFASSDAARDRLNAARSAIPRVEERLKNALQAIDGIRQVRTLALRRLQFIVAASVVLAVVFAGIVLDRLGKAQSAYDGAVAVLNRGDVAIFDQKVAEARSLIPGYRALEAASLRNTWQARESQYQRVVAALTQNDFGAFDKEVVALKALSLEYRQVEVAAAVIEAQYQRVAAALKQNSFGVFDKELAALKALSPAYRKPDVERLEQIRVIGAPKAGTKLTLRVPVSMEILFVPAGEFTMGSNPQIDRSADDDEQPQHLVTPNDFWIGRTEVTNDQYTAYTRAKGLSFSVPAGKGKHPVVNVSWNDAQGFVTWLSEQIGLVVRLPTEQEWEKACRGTDARLYPWGDSFDKTRLNSSEGGRGDTTVAGAYTPAGDSPYGAVDMVGNAWEWTSSNYTSDYRPTSNPDKSYRVLRGGGFHYDLTDSRCAGRVRVNPIYRDVIGGFRVAVSPFF